jgi:RNA polymerase sigma factor (TIGR02999 family)
MTSSHPATRLLLDHEAGQELDPARLFELVYDQLRRQARRAFDRRPGRQVMDPTELVHEVYVRLVDTEKIHWKGRTHFYAVSAGALRKVLMMHLRAQSAAKRGGRHEKVTLHSGLIPLPRGGAFDLLALDESLSLLHEVSPLQSRLMEMRLFAGLSARECAEAMNLPLRTVERELSVAKLWLTRELSGR